MQSCEESYQSPDTTGRSKKSGQPLHALEKSWVISLAVTVDLTVEDVFIS